LPLAFVVVCFWALWLLVSQEWAFGWVGGVGLEWQGRCCCYCCCCLVLMLFTVDIARHSCRQWQKSVRKKKGAEWKIFVCTKIEFSCHDVCWKNI